MWAGPERLFVCLPYFHNPLPWFTACLCSRTLDDLPERAPGTNISRAACCKYSQTELSPQQHFCAWLFEIKLLVSFYLREIVQLCLLLCVCVCPDVFRWALAGQRKFHDWNIRALRFEVWTLFCCFWWWLSMDCDEHNEWMTNTTGTSILWNK